VYLAMWGWIVGLRESNVEKLASFHVIGIEDAS
jgi:hypothetical protein